MLIDEAEPDMLASMSLPAQHRAKLPSTNPLEWLNGDIKRRTQVVGKFAARPFRVPIEDAPLCRFGAFLLERTDQKAFRCPSSMPLETMAPKSGNPLVSVLALGA
jgi:hypothetical protein